MVQLVVELLCLIILIRVITKRESISTKDMRGALTAAMALIFIGVFLFFAYSALKELPGFGQPLMRVAKNYIETGQAKTGASNLVASVILDFRAYDTLGEATVLFTAVIGVLVVMRQIGRKQKDEVVERYQRHDFNSKDHHAAYRRADTFVWHLYSAARASYARRRICRRSDNCIVICASYAGLWKGRGF